MIQEARKLSVPYSDFFISQGEQGQLPQRNEDNNHIEYLTVDDANSDVQAIEFDREIGIMHLVLKSGVILEIDNLPTIPMFGHGNSGPRGNQGKDGRDGFSGGDGEHGSRGCPGPIGLEGILGDVGKTGEDGFQGPTGQDGCCGTTGNQGPPGPVGPVGYEGKCGETGCNGNASGSATLGVVGITPSPYVAITASEPGPNVMVWGILQ